MKYLLLTILLAACGSEPETTTEAIPEKPATSNAAPEPVEVVEPAAPEVAPEPEPEPEPIAEPSQPEPLETYAAVFQADVYLGKLVAQDDVVTTIEVGGKKVDLREKFLRDGTRVITPGSVNSCLYTSPTCDTECYVRADGADDSYYAADYRGVYRFTMDAEPYVTGLRFQCERFADGTTAFITADEDLKVEVYETTRVPGLDHLTTLTERRLRIEEVSR